MYANNYKIADHVIKICSVHNGVHKLCNDYICEDSAEFEILTSQADIDFEREKSASEDKYEGIPIRNFSDGYLETLAVYRKICEKLVDDDIILFHGSVIAVDGEAYLFTAKSGTGKSTHTKLWCEYFGERAVMVNDDKPLLKITDNGIIAYGTPWNGKHNLGCNMSAPLKAICILERAENNHINNISFREAYQMILQQAYKPKDTLKMIKTFELIDRLGTNTKLYKLGCNISTEAVEIAYNEMKG